MAGLAPPVATAVLGLLNSTYRVEFVGDEPLMKSVAGGESVLMSFWHGSLVAMAVAARAKGIPICILVSQHRDGEIASRVLRRWGIDTVRGSATRGGAQGFLSLLRAHRRGSNLAVVPDGPKGPPKIAKLGVVHLARTTGARMFPLAFEADRFWRLGSWDRMVVPKPFARITIVVGDPITVARDTAGEDLETARLRIEASLNDLAAGVARHRDLLGAAERPGTEA